MATTSEEIVELENRYWRAIREGDVQTAVDLTDDPCIVSGAHGVSRVDKPGLAGMMQAERYKLDAYELGNVEVRSLGDDVAVLAYEVHEELTVEGQPVTLDAADSTTWVRRGGKWLCAAHSEALAGDPFGHRARG